MDNQPTPTSSSSLSDVLDRVLDKGVVIEAEISLAVAGLVVAGVEARIVVASMETYLEYADLIATHPFAWRGGPVARAEAEARARRARAPDTLENRIRDYWDVA